MWSKSGESGKGLLNTRGKAILQHPGGPLFPLEHVCIEEWLGRTAASTRPPLHNNEFKNKSYCSRKALSSWSYFFLLHFPGLHLMADFISELTNTHSCV